jgi:hypothetical protein
MVLARNLDPLSLFVNMGVAWVHHFAARPAEAAREALKTREIVPGFEEAGNVLIASYEALGRYEEAAELMTRQPSWGVQFDGAALAEAFRAGGPAEYWRKRLEMLGHAEAAGAPPTIHYLYAVVHYQLGQVDQALDRVERMVRDHTGGAVFLAVDPVLAPLHGHPRYEALLTRVGAPRQQTASIPHTASR